jgi:transcriptional regulator with XRE-family HTH domain
MSVGDRIKSARLRKGWSQSQLARSVGVKPQSVQQWEANEAAPNRKRIDVVAAVLDIRPEELLFGGEGDRLPDNQISNVIFPFGYRIVPAFSYAQVDEMTADSGPYQVTERMQNLWTNVSPLSDRAFCLIIEENGMREEFLPGDWVVIDPEVTPNPGDYVVAVLKDQQDALFRKFRPRGNDADGEPVIELAPLNDDYPIYQISSSHPGRVVGTMVEHRKFRRRDKPQESR